MPVTTVEGNLLEAVEPIIGHQVNCQSVMGSGVAKQIKQQFPDVYKAYLQYCSQHKQHLLGRCQIVERNEGSGTFVANLFGQEYYGRDKRKYTDYDAIRSAIVQLHDFAREHHYAIALPYKIGCDRGGGDWEIVYGMIHEIFTDVQVTLYRLAG
ncbi:hypothetical protein GCM10023310_28810 [Paenibacillus vulneris]|uniref:Macro domain-containing protein n=1 Tax=Paenibacillus vulneris TaxID=1133364 RepID=A0ABW3UQG5_9BACL